MMAARDLDRKIELTRSGKLYYIMYTNSGTMYVYLKIEQKYEIIELGVRLNVHYYTVISYCDRTTVLFWMVVKINSEQFIKIYKA